MQYALYNRILLKKVIIDGQCLAHSQCSINNYLIYRYLRFTIVGKAAQSGFIQTLLIFYTFNNIVYTTIINALHIVIHLPFITSQLETILLLFSLYRLKKYTKQKEA